MKNFYPTYLYVKTHNVTGLKYFGKTTKDPYLYRGSGKHWLAHLKIHGSNVSTEIVGFYTNEAECKRVALEFSAKNKIVESAEWANMIAENGTDGGDTNRKNYMPLSEETKRKLSDVKKGQMPWNTGLRGVTSGNKKPRTVEQKEKIRKSLLGRKRTPEAIAKTADKLRGRKRPDVAERMKNRVISEETKKKISDAQIGKIVSEETKKKIQEARKLQIFSDETREKLKGKIVCIDKNGTIMKIDREQFYAQPGTTDDKTWVFHNSTEGRRRKASTMRRG